MARALAGAERALVVEHNHDGQYLRLLRAEYDLDVELEPCHAPGPLPLRPGELAERIRARHPRFEEAPA
jgi:2-oxoglutarate ferredoxin oxidoreductase subunit alpha